MDTVDSLSWGGLLNALTPSRLVDTVYYFPVIGSTNDFAKELASGGAAEGAVIVSEEQSRGRGRGGKRWLTGPGTGICLSVILRPNLPPLNTIGITLVAAVAIARAIENRTGLRPGIKWPNDILIDGKKICGILTETGSDKNDGRYVVLGIGVNVNDEEFPPEIRKRATSLKMCLGHRVNRKDLIVEFIKQLEEVYPGFSAEGTLAGIIETYRQYSVTIGRKVRVIGRRGGFPALAIDVAANGSLLLKKEDGIIVAVNSGEVTLRSYKLCHCSKHKLANEVS